jgi:fatty acid desaturase
MTTVISAPGSITYPYSNKCSEDLWHINGNAYDLSNFKHPGGDVALSLAKGRDATELYHSYHPFTENHKLVLEKYRVANAALLPSPFEWNKKSLFYEDVRHQVEKVMKRVGSKYAPLERWLQIFTMFVFTVITAYYFIAGAWWALFAFPLSYWFLCINTYHDASHFSLARNWKINHLITFLFPPFCSSKTWYHEHVIGHHVYTNQAWKDPDLHHATFAWRITNTTPYLPYFRLQLYYLPVIWSIIVFYLRFIVDLSLNLTGRYHYIRTIKASKTEKFVNIIMTLITFFTIFLWPFLFTNFSLTKAFAFALVPYIIFSTCFSLASQLNHTTPETMDQEHRLNWFEDQCITSHTFAPQSTFWLLMTGGLNLQVEHHLFPGINSWHLRTIQPIIENCCRKHNIPYNLSLTASEGLLKYMKQLWKVSTLNKIPIYIQT